MPEEFSRTTKVKRLTPPVDAGDEPDKSDDARHVDVPVIQTIKFKDPKTNSQEYNFHFINGSGSSDDNTDATTRKVHVHTVANARLDDDGVTVTYADVSKPLAGGDNAISVERVEKYHHKDAKTSAQQSVYRIYRNDPDPPPTNVGDLVSHFSKDPITKLPVDPPLTQAVWVDGDGKTFTQLKSHVVRYYMKNDNTQAVWVDMELTDAFKFRDAKENSQERVFTLNNDSLDGKPGKVGKKVSDPSLPNPDTTDPFDPTEAVFDGSKPDNLDETSKVVDPPWRFDPFQQVVNVSWLAGIFVLFENSGPVPAGSITEGFDIIEFHVDTSRVNRIHTSRDGKAWTTVEVPGDAWAYFIPYAYGNGAWIFGYNESNGWIYGRDGGGGGVGPWSYSLFGLDSGQSTVVMSTNGFDWSKVVGDAGSFPPYHAEDGQLVLTNDPPIINLAFPVNPFPPPVLNDFTFRKLVTPIIHAPVYETVAVPNPLRPGTVPTTVSIPYPGKITTVATVDPVLGSGNPGFWYSEDRGISWSHTLTFPPNTSIFQTDLQLSFDPPGRSR
jgi:hypothetical protein